MNNKLIPLVITLVVGIILAGSVLMPVLNDATRTEKTMVNDGYFTMSKVSADATTTYVIDWDKTTNALTVNDEAIDMTKFPSSGTAVTLVGCDGLCVRFQNGLRVQWFDNAQSSSSGYTSTHVELEVASGTCTGSFTDGETVVERTFTYTELFVIDPNGNYVMKDATKTAYVNADSEFYGIGITSLTNEANIGFYIVGSIEEGLEISKFRGSSTPTYTNEAINYTATSGFVDLYDLSTITFTATNSEGATEVTYSYFVVPKEVTSELSEHLTPGQISLMGAIPVMVIVVLLMLAVGAIAYRRAD